MSNKLDDSASLADDPLFIKRVKAAMLRVVLRESGAVYVAQHTDPHDKLRLRFYNDVVKNTNTYGPQFAWVLACIVSVDANATDIELMNNVTRVVDLFAGINVDNVQQI